MEKLPPPDEHRVSFRRTGKSAFWQICQQTSFAGDDSVEGRCGMLLVYVHCVEQLTRVERLPKNTLAGLAISWYLDRFHEHTQERSLKELRDGARHALHVATCPSVDESSLFSVLLLWRWIHCIGTTCQENPWRNRHDAARWCLVHPSARPCFDACHEFFNHHPFNIDRHCLQQLQQKLLAILRGNVFTT